MQCFNCQHDTLTAADTKGDDTARQAVLAHRVDQLGRQHGASRADRMIMATPLKQARSWASSRAGAEPAHTSSGSTSWNFV